MNIERLHEILADTTVPLRKGEEVTGDSTVMHIYAMPHQSKVDGDTNIEKVDCHFIVVGVDKETAQDYKNELIAILDTYPEPERLAGGPSYIEVGAVLGDQMAAFQLFALGKFLGLWDIITPAAMGFSGAEAGQMAGAGFVMTTGLRVAAAR